jgi:hypothetical protein
MNIVLEMMNELLLQENDRLKGDQIPNGAFVSYESFRDYVNTHQQPLSADYHLPEYYQSDNLADFCQYLRTIELPTTTCAVYKVCVPRDCTQTSVEVVHIPVLGNLVHDPDMFGHTADLDRERALSRKNHFPAWRSGYSGTQELRIDHFHVGTVGIDQNQRCNQWRMFARQEDADVYVAMMKSTVREDTPLHRVTDAMMKSIADGADDFDNNW